MKKLAILVSIFTISTGVFSQRYIQLSKDTLIGDKKFYKNEIYESITVDTQAQKATYMFGIESISINKSGYISVKQLAKDYREMKDSIIKKTDSVNYLIDVTGSYIPANDTVKFVGSKGNVMLLFKNRKESISIIQAGETFRVIIPNTPTIVYNKSEIPGPVVKSEESNDGTTAPSKPFLKKYASLLITLLLLIIAGGLLFLRKRNRTEGKTEAFRVKYTGGSFSEFAEKNNVGFNDFLKWNKDKIPSSYKKEDDKRKKQEIQKALKNQDFIVRFTIPKENSIDIPSTLDPLFIEKKDKPDANGVDNLSANEDSSKIIKALIKLESTLSSKIDSLSFSKASAEERSKLIQEKESLNQQLKELKEKNQILNDGKIKLESELNNAVETKTYAETTVKKYTERLLFVEFLENHAKVAADYFVLLQTISDKAFELYKKLATNNKKDATILSHILTKYQLSVPAKCGNWEEIILEIKNGKTISKPDLIRSFSQLPNNDEKIRTFQHLLHKEVLERYTGASLLLAEELKNFSKFTGENTGIIKDIELSFTALTKEIVNKAKSVGLDINHAPLFENYEPYASITRAVSEIRSLPYTNIRVEKDSIAEVISYGFGTEATKIILA